MRTPTATDIVASERLMVGMRWLIALWAVFQITLDESFFPSGVRPWAFLLVGVLLVGNLALWFATHRTASDRDARRIAVASVGFDLVIVMSFVMLYAFDPDRSLWALMFIVPIEGAARFQMRGVLTSWAVLVVLYVGKELWAEATFGLPVHVSSITFRMGLVLVAGVLAGRLAQQLHDQKAVLAAALARLERVDGWRSRLVQMLAHDIRSPLGAIDSSAQLLLQRRDRLDDRRISDLLGAIRRHSARVQYLASDLLDLARSESESLQLSPEAFDVGELVREVTPLISREDAEVRIEGDAGVQVVADRQRLSQVYANLLTNALRHGRPPVRVVISEDDSWANLSVVDSGEGVRPDVADRLFSAFGGGGEGSVGLGLWMSRLLVEAHGGRLDYERDEAAGTTTFCVLLPAEPAREADPEPAAGVSETA